MDVTLISVLFLWAVAVSIILTFFKGKEATLDDYEYAEADLKEALLEQFKGKKVTPKLVEDFTLSLIKGGREVGPSNITDITR